LEPRSRKSNGLKLIVSLLLSKSKIIASASSSPFSTFALAR